MSSAKPVPSSTPSKIEIVAAHEDDAADVVALEHETWRRYVNQTAGISGSDIETHLKHSPLEEQITGWKVIINNNLSVEFLAKDHGKTVGFVSLEKDPAGEINQICVMHGYEDTARQLLLDTALDFIGPELPVQVFVVDFDDATKKFYLGNGFAPTGEIIKRFSFASGAELPEIKLVKSSS